MLERTTPKAGPTGAPESFLKLGSVLDQKLSSGDLIDSKEDVFAAIVLKMISLNPSKEYIGAVKWSVGMAMFGI